MIIFIDEGDFFLQTETEAETHQLKALFMEDETQKYYSSLSVDRKTFSIKLLPKTGHSEDCDYKLISINTI